MKFIILSLIFGGTSYIGILISKKYDNRLKELQEIKSAIHMLEIKIKFTYDTIPKIFREIETKYMKNIGKIFGVASEKMESSSVEKAWNDAIDETTNNLTKKDKEILKDLGKLLGKTDVEGQISQIKLVLDFLEIQIGEANSEKLKNQKLYRTLRNDSRARYCNYISLKSKEREEICCFYTSIYIKKMDINLLFKIAAIGILVAVLQQVLARAGREDQAMMTTLAGLVIVLTMVIKEISTLFSTVRTIFSL